MTKNTPWWQSGAWVSTLTSVIGALVAAVTALHGMLAKQTEVALATSRHEHEVAAFYFRAAIDPASTPELRQRVLRYLANSLYFEAQRRPPAQAADDAAGATRRDPGAQHVDAYLREAALEAPTQLSVWAWLELREADAIVELRKRELEAITKLQQAEEKIAEISRQMTEARTTDRGALEAERARVREERRAHAAAVETVERKLARLAAPTVRDVPAPASGLERPPPPPPAPEPAPSPAASAPARFDCSPCPTETQYVEDLMQCTTRSCRRELEALRTRCQQEGCA